MNPLVTCIYFNTKGTYSVYRALKMFWDQAYCNKEIIIVDDNKSNIYVPKDNKIIYIQVAKQCDKRQKINIAMKYAKGNTCVLWDHHAMLWTYTLRDCASKIIKH